MSMEVNRERIVNSSGPEKCGSNFASIFVRLDLPFDILSTSLKLILGERHRTALIIRQHWFSLWYGAVRQQSVIGDNDGPYPYRLIA